MPLHKSFMEENVYMANWDLKYELDNSDCGEECSDLYIRTRTETKVPYSSVEDDNTWSPYYTLYRENEVILLYSQRVKGKNLQTDSHMTHSTRSQLRLK